MRDVERVQAQRAQEAWQMVEALCQTALLALVAANEGPSSQAELANLVERAHVQAKLWGIPENA